MRGRVARIIKAYSDQGTHRSGTDVDLASGAWFRSEIKVLGIKPEDDRFSFRRVRPVKNTVVIDGIAVEGIPLYDCSYTDREGVRGRLGELGSGAEIGVVSAFPHEQAPGGQALMKARHERRHKAIIVLTDERMPPGTAIFNAEHFSEPFGPPVIQLSNTETPRVTQAIASATQATVTVHCDYVEATGVNVGARLRGSKDNLNPLVIMTPRSGWWACASERGGGIACWLEMMRAIQEAGPERDVIFTANTGHELGHIGLDHYLAPRQRLIGDAHMWIHLGANFAAQASMGVRLQFSDAEARALTFEALASRSLKPDIATEISQRPFGEARNIHDGNGRYISLLGGNGLFHHPADVWPDAVDLDRTVLWVAAFTELAVTLARAA